MFWDRRGLGQNVFEAVFVFMHLHIVRPVFVQTCPNADSTRSQQSGVIKIVIIISNQFDSNLLKGAATLHI